MEQQTNAADDYKIIISELIKKQIKTIGPAIALSVVWKIPSVKITQDGSVVEIIGDPKAVLEQVAEAYIVFSGEISRMIIKSVMVHHPGIQINYF